MSNETTTPTESTETPVEIVHLAPLVAALESATDCESRGRLFAVLAEEALELASADPGTPLLRLWDDLHETFHYESQLRLDPPKPRKRRWFR